MTYTDHSPAIEAIAILRANDLITEVITNGTQATTAALAVVIVADLIDAGWVVPTAGAPHTDHDLVSAINYDPTCTPLKYSQQWALSYLMVWRDHESPSWHGLSPQAVAGRILGRLLDIGWRPA
jgi:hypothetical protein